MRLFIALAALVALTVPLAATADHVSADWDDGNVGGWFPATGAATLAVWPTDGYGGGYLESYEQPFTYGIAGAINYAAAYTGDFNVHGYVRMQVAVSFLAGTFDTVYIHIRYQDSAHNGWYLPLAADLGSGGWQWFDVSFDPHWIDQQALDAGWLQETSSPSFSTTMSDVYHTGIKATGIGALSLGLDSFRLWDGTVPPVEFSWGEIKALYR